MYTKKQHSFLQQFYNNLNFLTHIHTYIYIYIIETLTYFTTVYHEMSKRFEKNIDKLISLFFEIIYS